MERQSTQSHKSGELGLVELSNLGGNERGALQSSVGQQWHRLSGKTDKTHLLLVDGDDEAVEVSGAGAELLSLDLLGDG